MSKIYFYFLPAALLIIAGLFLIFVSSRRLGFPFGYRTNLSMQNLDVWNFSNTWLGTYMLLCSAVSAGIGFLFLRFIESDAGVYIVIIISSFFPVIASYITGRRTYEYYDDNGLRIK